MSRPTTTLPERARQLRALHHAETMLILPNAWDVVSARIFEDAGFAAIGTTSFGIARSHGHRDGENAALDVTLAMVRRMADALSVPLTVDMEAGYGDTPEAVAEHGRQLIRAGAVGFNLEDGQADARSLADPALQSEKIAALKEAGAGSGVPIFVNARTDVFWLGVATGGAAMDEALRRAEAYARAGADGIFIPGLTEPAGIARAVEAVEAPLNILAGSRTPPAGELAALGVRRLSLGSGPFRACLGLLRAVGRELLERGTYGFLDDAVPYEEANRI